MENNKWYPVSSKERPPSGSRILVAFKIPNTKIHGTMEAIYDCPFFIGMHLEPIQQSMLTHFMSVSDPNS